MKNCFIIVNFNDYKSTKHLVDNIIDYKVIDEIVIVDNNSNNQEKQLLKGIKHKKINTIWNNDNLGYSHAINVGSRYLIDKYGKCNLIVSNSDIVIMSEEDIVRLVDLLNYESIGLVGPQLLERGQIIRGFKDISLRYEILNNLPVINNFVSDKILYYPDNYYEGSLSFVDVVSSSFFLINSDTLKKINFMDENVFLYYEDFILCKKVRNNGLMVAVSNEVKVKHLYSVSVDKNIGSVKKENLYKKSKLYYHTTFHKVGPIGRFFLKFSSNVRIIKKHVTHIW